MVGFSHPLEPYMNIENEDLSALFFLHTEINVYNIILFIHLRVYYRNSKCVLVLML